MKTFTLAAVSLNPRSGSPRANLPYVLNGIERAVSSNANLVLFSEGILSGYDINHISESACAVDSPEIQAIRDFAEKMNVYTSVGFIEKASSGYYISQLYAGPRFVSVYRKCHLTEDERAICRAGESLQVEDLGFVKIGTQICYDSAFPCVSESLVKMGAELLFTPTGHSFYSTSCKDRCYADAIQSRRRHVLKYWRARAYDYSAYAVYLDAVGETEDGEWFPGYIGIYGPDGEIIGESTTGMESMVCVELDLFKLRSARADWIGHYKALADQRTELYVL